MTGQLSLPSPFTPNAARAMVSAGAQVTPVITGLKRISTPGLRTYVGSQDVPRVLGGLGSGFGFAAGAVCYAALKVKNLLRLDDSLDVIAVHLVGGILGAMLLGLFADKAVNAAGSDGLFFGGGAGLLGKQALAVVVTFGFSFVVTYVVARILDATMGLRVTDEDELVGLDQSQHAEQAYQ